MYSKLYSKLYASMLTWYGQWYSNWTQRNLVAVLALTITMMLNVLSIVNLLTIIRVPAPSEFLYDGKRFTTFVVGLTVAHLIFVNKHAARGEQGREESSNLASKKIAAFYMALSFVLFLSTFMALTALHIRP
jgi:hypothetical protein